MDKKIRLQEHQTFQKKITSGNSKQLKNGFKISKGIYFISFYFFMCLVDTTEHNINLEILTKNLNHSYETYYKFMDFFLL